MSDVFDREEIERIISDRGAGPEALIPILLDVQSRYGYLPEPALRAVCDGTAVTPANLAGVLSFYPRFRTRPAGRHRIQVCVGTACHVRGALDTRDELLHQLGIPTGEDTDRDRLFTVEQVACLGCCMLAPAVRIGMHTYGHVEAGRVPDVLSDYLESFGTGEEGDGHTAPPPVQPRRRPPAGEARICLCTSCRSAGAEDVHREAVSQIKRLDLPASVRSVGCTGLSSEAPLVDISMVDGRSWRYGRISPDQVRPLLLEHFKPGRRSVRIGAAAARLLDRILDGDAGDPVIRYRLGRDTAGGFGLEERQVRIATRHAGEIDPLDLDAYLSRGGFAALRRSLDELTPREVIETLTASGLRGRGGAGYLTGSKWKEAREAAGEKKYVICNGDEGDPGAFMDRMILESFPFRVIEGMVIAAAAVGAKRGYLYIRGEYDQAIARVRAAIRLCAGEGYLGSSVLGTGRACELEVFEGAGAFVCGEETALIEAMEGRRGMPRVRPPFPSERGLRGCPTLINNVETLALVPAVLRGDPEAFADLGTPSSRGTKTFALAGRIARGGLIEVPMGTTLGEIVEGIGGGVPGGRRLKAIQIGGPSGGCVPANQAGTPVDYEALQAAGAIMGSGGMIVLDEGDCMVDLARYFTAFARRESCGKCSACRVGTARMLDILDDLCGGRGREPHLARIEEIGDHLRRASLCGLGRTAPNTVLSTLRHFRDEYLDHIAGRCPAGRCKALIRYVIKEHCIGCTRCAQRCPSGSIDVDPYQTHRVDDSTCIRCDICRQVCPVAAVEVL